MWDRVVLGIELIRYDFENTSWFPAQQSHFLLSEESRGKQENVFHFLVC